MENHILLVGDNYLLVKVNELFVWQFERLYGLKDGVPMAVIDIRDKSIYAVHRIQRYACFLLKQNPASALPEPNVNEQPSQNHTCSVCNVFTRFDSFRYCWISRITLKNNII